MNHLSLQQALIQGFPDPVARIFIDGYNLVDTVRSIELPFAREEGSESIAGAYEGLPWAEVVGEASVLLGGPNQYVGSPDLVPLLTCSGCGEFGCWPLMAALQVTEDTVTWSSLRQPHRPAWNLGAVGPFTFRARDYRRVVGGLKP